MKVFLVWSGEYSDRWVSAIFSSEEAANEYVRVHEKLNDWETYYVDGREVDTRDFKGVEVKEYSYTRVYLKDVEYEWASGTESHKAGELDEDLEGTENMIYKSDVVVSNHEDEYLTVHSTQGLDHARKVAIEKYQIHTQQKLVDEGVL